MGCQSFIDISNNSIELINLSVERKVIDFARFTFPTTINADSLSNRISEVLNSSEFKELLMGKEPKFSFGESNTSIIPSALFSEKEIENVALLENLDANKCSSQTLSNHEAIGVFQSNEFDSISTLSNSFLFWIDQLDFSVQSPNIQLVIGEIKTTIVLANKGRMQLVNSFETNSENDILYFILAALESQEILHSSTSICLWGNISKGDKTHQKISKYFKTVTFGKLPSSLTYAYSISKLESHRYPFIFAAVCE